MCGNEVAAVATARVDLAAVAAVTVRGELRLDRTDRACTAMCAIQSG